MIIRQLLSRIGFKTLCIIGKHFGGIRPRRVYHWLARRGHTAADFRWVRNRWGYRLNLSPHFFLDRQIISFGEYDPILHRLIQKYVLPGMICMDIGANIGEMTLHMAKRVGETGKVFAFEPVTFVRDRLIENIKMNNAEEIIHVSGFALSNMDGNAEIAYADPMTENQGMGSLVNKENEVVAYTENVKTIKLDTFVDDNNINRIDIIKLDIQGAEPMALEGARNVLNRFSPIMFIEISPSDLACIGKTARDLVLQIESLGYRVYEYDKHLTCNHLLGNEIAIDYSAENILCCKNSLHTSIQVR